jgi:hypothetical protein
MNHEFVLQALHQHLDRAVKSHVDLVEQCEKIKDENDDLKFQVCECLNNGVVLNVDFMKCYNFYCYHSKLYLCNYLSLS